MMRAVAAGRAGGCPLVTEVTAARSSLADATGALSVSWQISSYLQFKYIHAILLSSWRQLRLRHCILITQSECLHEFRFEEVILRSVSRKKKGGKPLKTSSA